MLLLTLVVLHKFCADVVFSVHLSHLLICIETKEISDIDIIGLFC
jgi:hypothetical protein